MLETRPTGITANRTTREFSVTWDDGHQSIYSFSLLRAGCPCAECRGGHDKMGGDPEPEVFATPDVESPATRLVQVEAIGSYALTIQWEDGHHFGIYTWRYLRALCPCAECRSQA